jgi:predicted nucleotidyltransferase
MTSDDEPLLDRARIRELFTRLGERLQRRGVVGDVYVIGGAAMALAYDARRATRDIDAVLLPHGIVLEEAHALAKELGLPQWWLNEQASMYVAPGGDAAAPLTFDHAGLRVSTASPEHLLAMKAIAARRRDIDDLRVLVRLLKLTAPEQVVAICARVFPDEALPDRTRLVLDDLFEEKPAP